MEFSANFSKLLFFPFRKERKWGFKLCFFNLPLESKILPVRTPNDKVSINSFSQYFTTNKSNSEKLSDKWKFDNQCGPLYPFPSGIKL